ncbi:hypothetical protein OBK20_03185 [Empedobacter falsenii]|uniref:Lipoprotein n=2 Tax=Weeksellaceae TaxID=2762318 RepID=A0ABY8V656_9FLAO|nr:MULTISPECIES: hypothetical protein [Empedobacter]MDM1522606.1 hypothetical protein [Empedobacter sp. 225-1]WIH96652.1 hypothetical protein OBA43_10320 [Empedobacter falsenii]
MKKILLFVLFVTIFWKGCDLFDDFTNRKAVIKEIQKDFSGIIMEKYSPRDTPPIFLKIKNQNTILDISFSRGVMNISSIGDSIYKLPNDNYVYIVKPNGKVYKECFQRIRKETRDNKQFPLEWKNKWLDTASCGE